MANSFQWDQFQLDAGTMAVALIPQETDGGGEQGTEIGEASRITVDRGMDAGGPDLPDFNSADDRHILVHGCIPPNA
jgi:hypothetical protein